MLETVIASEAKQSIGAAQMVTMDCFVAPPLAMTGLDFELSKEGMR